MNWLNWDEARKAAIEAAIEAGALMRRYLGSSKAVRISTAHDIRLELDLKIQRRIHLFLKKAFPYAAFLGEEEEPKKEDSLTLRWVVDPIDGTVNYAYGIPHACVSIALQRHINIEEEELLRARFIDADGYETILGVVYDPFCDELWTADMRRKSRLNGDLVRVKPRPLSEAIVCLGFGKSEEALDYLERTLKNIRGKVRKVRIMGSAALALAYVATGRFDIYVEPMLQLWDIAAGSIIVERAGGFFKGIASSDRTYKVIAHNGRVDLELKQLLSDF